MDYYTRRALGSTSVSPGPCAPVKTRKHHPCNPCGEPIFKGSKVYKHSGAAVSSRGMSYPVWFYVCESCHLLRGLADKPCDSNKRDWDPAMFSIEGVDYLRAFGKLDPIGSDVKYVLIGGKLVWERK